MAKHVLTKPDKPLTEKQEAFAIEVAKGKSLAEAYRIAYGKDNSRQARFFAQRPHVAARIEELRAEVKKKGVVSIEDHVAMLQRLRDDAHASGDFSSAVKAQESIGKVGGFYVQKAEVRTGPLEDMSDDALRARIRDLEGSPGIRAALGRAGSEAGPAEAGAVQPVPEAEGVPRSRLN